ncbi:ribbon-helix-helix domain-containing protein [Rhodococcus koreensis]
MNTENEEPDFGRLAEWAERDMKLPENSATANRGQDAAAAGRELLDRVGAGRPSLGQADGVSGESPRRQVRLPRPLSERLDRFAENQHRKPSDVMREAVEEYLEAHSG